jgi:peptidoglycan/xylan/chitin deacetylase (PgdA/CDA1 family)
MDILKAIRRNCVAPIIYHSSQILGGFSRIRNRLIVNYHGVIGGRFDRINTRHVPALQFEKDLQFYQKYFEVVTLECIWKSASEVSEKGKPQLAITFDDGFRNNFDFALPILERYGLPATIFVMSQSIVDRGFVNWTDILDVIKAVHDGDRIRFMGKEFIRNHLGEFVLENDIQTMSDLIKNSGFERMVPIDELFQKYLHGKSSVEKYRAQIDLMSPEQIRECSRNRRIEIGSHSRFHFNMSKISPNLAFSELSESKSCIENLIQQPVLSFAYPDGDYDSVTKDLAESSGYRRQLAVKLRLNDDLEDLRIRQRFSYSNSTTHKSNMVRLVKDWGNTSFL